MIDLSSYGFKVVARAPSIEERKPFTIEELVKGWKRIVSDVRRATVTKSKQGIKQGFQSFSVDEDSGEDERSQWIHSFVLSFIQNGKQVDEVDLSTKFSLSIEVITSVSYLEHLLRDTTTHEFDRAVEIEVFNVLNNDMQDAARELMSGHGQH